MLASVDPIPIDPHVNAISGQVVDAAMTVHKEVGPGLLESVYHAFLRSELEGRGLEVETEVPVPATYRGITVKSGYRADLLVEDEVLVELKAVGEVRPVHKAQTLTYLRLLDRRVGLLINFNVRRLVEGLTRIAN